eukprot:jgi/Orpsp1_1/1185786/evm.model.c7180000095239.1
MIAMERAECSLEDIVNERGHLSEEEAIPILKEILYALQVMHKNNFIHRDLKLSNILLSSRNDLTSIKIIDFGETVDRTDDYQVNGIVGTLHYMAPEILKKKKYGKPVDIWAFGVIAYRLLTGYFPYMIEGDNHSKQLKAILNNDVSYLCADDERLSIKAIDFINCILDPEPNNRMGIQTALNHPFLNPYFEGEFVPYKPIPKFTKKMSKENMKDDKPLNVKSIFRKTVKMTKKQDIVGGSEKIIKTLFTKDGKSKFEDTEPDKIVVTEDENYEKNNDINYSKTCVQPSHHNAPYISASQTINRNFRNKRNDDNIPEYLNVTLGRNNNNNLVKTAGNSIEPKINYSPNNSPSNVNYNNNNNNNNNYNDMTGGNVNEHQIKYSPSYSPSNYKYNNYNSNNNYDNYNYNSNNNNNNYDNGNNQIKYSKTYVAPTGKSAGNISDSNQIKYSKTLAPPKLPKTAGNSIDAYQPQDEYKFKNNNTNKLSPPKLPKTAGNSIDAYSPQNGTAGNTIYTYEEFEDVVNRPNTTRHNRAHSDSTNRINNSEGYYQNSQNYGTLPMNRGRNNIYNNNNNGGMNQLNVKYGSEIGKSNTYSGSSRQKPEYNHYPPHNNYPSKPVDDSQPRYHHRKTSSSGSNPRYDYDSDTLQNHHRKINTNNNYDNLQNRHRKTPSSGSNPDYLSTNQSSPKMDIPVLKMSPLSNSGTIKSSSNPVMDNHNKQYITKRPSPLANAATIKTSNSIDDKYRQSCKNEVTNNSKENLKTDKGSYFSNAEMINSKGKNESKENDESKKSKNKIKNFMDIKLKINVPKKLPKVISVNSNHPERNSSLTKNKK